MCKRFAEASPHMNKGLSATRHEDGESVVREALLGGSELWWQVVFTPHYTASFLVDELRPFPAVFGPSIEAQIPLLPNEDNARSFESFRSERDCNITTCQTKKAVSYVATNWVFRAGGAQ